jgi:hypothetical protein
MSFFIYADRFDPRHVHFGPTQCEHPSINTNTSIHTNTNTNTNTNATTTIFSRITYSTNHISLNNVGFVLSDASVASLVRAECAILDKYVLQRGEPRRPVHSIAPAADTSSAITIYGVWETHDECGLVYKGSP